MELCTHPATVLALIAFTVRSALSALSTYCTQHSARSTLLSPLTAELTLRVS